MSSNVCGTTDLIFSECSTDSMNNELKAATDIDKYLNRNEKNMINCTLSDYLNTLLYEKEISLPDVIRVSQLDRGYVYQIFSGRKTPSRDKLIAIAFGLGLSDEETQKMLKISGNRELYVKDKRDSIILYCLQRKKNLSDTNDLLYDYNFEALGNIKD